MENTLIKHLKIVANQTSADTVGLLQFEFSRGFGSVYILKSSRKSKNKERGSLWGDKLIAIYSWFFPGKNVSIIISTFALFSVPYTRYF